MPLLLTKPINAHSAYAVWNIQETNHELKKNCVDPIPEGLHPTKTAEWMVGRILVKSLCTQFGLTYQGIHYSQTGKPLLLGTPVEISISHSFPMAAAMIHLKQPCGIDLERPRHKMFAVRDKFVNGAEVRFAEDLHHLCAIWCAKEVLYKIYSRKKLSLKDDMVVNFVHDHMTGTIINSHDGSSQLFNIAKEEIRDYLLAYNF